MKLSKILTTTALTLSMLAAGGIAAHAQSDTSGQNKAEPKASAQAQEGRSNARGERGERGSKGKRHGKRGYHGQHHGKRGGGEMFGAMFAKIDADGDGMVTQEEIDTYRAEKLTEFDASGDGALSIEEFDELYRELTRSRMVRAFQRLDADGDGVITTEEMDAQFGNIVERMDRDGSGALSLKGRGNRQ